MSDSAKCPRCGSEQPAGFSPGVCPTCLMQQGLSASTIMGRAGSASGSGRRYQWTPPTPAELAPRFPQLEIVELLGQGGMGAVYKVRQRDLDRWAALKILPDEVAHDPNFAERFQREARALALLGHQHIVIVYEFGQRDGVYFLLMEYIDGVNLRQAIRSGQISAGEALGIVTQICDGLQFAHEEGVVHRDIKPENILIDKRGRVKIADFGLAKLLGGDSMESPTLTGTHQVMGTPMYMAPEQMEGTHGVDHRADIFSLGVVFYELLTGELPLGRFAPPSQKYQLDVRLDEVVLRTLEKKPDRRYQNASDVKCDVESIRSRPVEVPQVSPKSLRKSWIRNRFVGRLVALFAFLGLIGLLATVAYEIEQAARFRSQRDAERQAESARYISLLAKPEREAQPRSNESDEDPNEVRAIVQFTPAEAKLHPDFGTGLITEAHRQIINSILTEIHQAYLAEEARHTSFGTNPDGWQTTVVEVFGPEVAKLENKLWTEIDSKLPVEQQRFLRQNLPLFADVRKPLPLVNSGAGGPTNAITPMGPPFMMSMGGSMKMGSYLSNIRYAQLLGFWQNNFGLRIDLGRQGKWFRWRIYSASNEFRDEIRQDGWGSPIDSGEAPEIPSGIRRFWHGDVALEAGLTTKDQDLGNPDSDLQSLPGARSINPTETELPGMPDIPIEKSTLVNPADSSEPSDIQNEPVQTSLADRLLVLDSLRRGEQTPWNEVEQETNFLLSKFQSPADVGSIHWQAAHVYGQSDIRGHANDVTRHAKTGLKYVRDPVKRGWLYMYLGAAAEVRDNDPKHFVERRTDATRWYLKGYAELLPFRLPDVAPEIPGLGGSRRDDPTVGEGEFDPDQVARQVQLDAQLRTRREAEFTRDLVQRRDTYLGSLRELFVRLHVIYDKEANAKDRLKSIADEVLLDPPEIEKLLKLVFRVPLD